MAVPHVRARSVLDFMAYLRKTRPGLVESIFERMPQESQRALTDAVPTSWLSIEHSRLWVADFVREVGATDAQELAADFTHHWILRSPVLKALVQSMIRLKGIGPEIGRAHV